MCSLVDFLLRQYNDLDYLSFAFELNKPIKVIDFQLAKLASAHRFIIQFCTIYLFGKWDTILLCVSHHYHN